MGRKKLDVPATAPVVVVNAEAVSRDLDEAAAIRAATADAAILWRMVGRVEMADAIQIFGNAAKVAAFETAKTSKAYLGIINPKTKTHFGSLEEFCEVALGGGYERMRQLTLNRNAVGQELFEKSEQLGLRQIDYNAIKALPAPKQEIIRQAIAEGSSRADLVEAIQELAAQDQRDIEALTADLTEARQRITAKDKVLEDNALAMQGLREELHGRRSDPEFEAAASLRELDEQSLACATTIATSLRSAMVAALKVDGDRAPLALQANAAALGRILAAVRTLAEDFGIALTGPTAAPEANDEAAEDAAIWARVNAEMAAERGGSDETAR